MSFRRLLDFRVMELCEWGHPWEELTVAAQGGSIAEGLKANFSLPLGDHMPLVGKATQILCASVFLINK